MSDKIKLNIEYNFGENREGSFEIDDSDKEAYKKKGKVDISKVITELTNIETKYNLGYFNKDSKTVSGFFIQEHKVPNAYRYKLNRKIKYQYAISPLPNNHNESDIQKDDIPIILLLLESPHKSEYESDRKKKIFNPIGPAKGKTNTGIKVSSDIVVNLINEKIKRYKLNKEEYKLIIYNPIPYQTSLDFLHNKGVGDVSYGYVRDKVWLGLWDNDETFKKTLTTFIENNNSNIELIINACTVKLSEKVNLCINNSQYNKHLFSTNHPCSWSDFGINKI